MRIPRTIRHWIYRRKLGLERVPLNQFKIRLAKTVDDYEGAFRLVQAAYISKGIEQALSDTVRISPQHVLPESYVLLAEEGDRLVGTMTVTIDSAALVPLDKDYPAELAALRAHGHRLAELGSLAVVDRCHRLGVTALMNMAAIQIATRIHDATHLVAGVNPEAIGHYQVVYGFDRLLGAQKAHAQLRAPVVGMACDLAKAELHFRKYFDRPLENGTRIVDAFLHCPPDCIDLPKGSPAELIRWKLSREVFQELFVRRTNRVETLDARTRRHLELLRSPLTITGYRGPFMGANQPLPE